MIKVQSVSEMSEQDKAERKSPLITVDISKLLQHVSIWEKRASARFFSELRPSRKVKGAYRPLGMGPSYGPAPKRRWNLMQERSR